MARMVVERGSCATAELRRPDARLYGLLRIAALICLYFTLSIGLTFYQKDFIKHFRYPLLTGLFHMSMKWILSCSVRNALACWRGRHRTSLAWRDVLRSTVPIGFTSGIDISFSNWAFEFINVSLYTMTKSTSIVFILFFAVIFKLEKKSWSMFGIVFMIAVGLFMFTYKSVEFNTIGFILVLLASFFSGIRWTLCQFVMQKSNMGLEHPIDLMYHLQPWMFLVILPFFCAFEGEDIITALPTVWSNRAAVLHNSLLLLIGGSIAFLLELVEYKVVSTLSSLSLSIAAVFKEVLTLVLAMLSGEKMSLTNGVGLLICLGGIILHVATKASSHRTDSSPSGVKALSLIKDEASARFLHDDLSSSEEMDDDKDDSTEVLFSVLHSRDR